MTMRIEKLTVNGRRYVRWKAADVEAEKAGEYDKD